MSRFGKNEKATATITFRIEPSLKKDLELLAENEGMSVGTYLRYLVREEVDQEFREAKQALEKEVRKRP